MKRRVVVCLVALVAGLGLPASARAATLRSETGVATYAAAPGFDNNLTVERPVAFPGQANFTRGGADGDLIAETTCSPFDSEHYSCAGISQIVVDVGDGSDLVNAAGLSDIP